MTFLSKETQRELARTLQPCPFCGSEDLYIYRIASGVICCNCGARMEGYDWHRKWNERVME